VLRCAAIAVGLLMYAQTAKAGFNEPVGCTALPALTGVVTTPSGSCATAAGTAGLVKVSTQTVSAGASIAFTGLATYVNYQLECTAVFPATPSTGLFLQVGEGGTPTWETSSYSYTRMIIISNSATVVPDAQSGASGLNLASSVGAVATSWTGSFTIHNATSTNTVKHMTGHGALLSTDQYNVVYSGAYIGDTNAITAIRLIAASGNISGVCTLYGFTP